MVNGGVAGAIAAAAVASRRRKILRAFREAGATSPEGAVPEATLDTHGNLLFRRMVRSGVIVRLPDGRLYLDEAAEDRTRRMRFRILAAILVVAVIALAWVLGLRR
jgi:hypothetical protein